MSTTVTKAYREVIVPPRAAGREAAWLAAALCLIVLLAGLRFLQTRPVNTETESKAYQLQDIRLQNQAPVLYRSLLGAADTVTWLYEAEGAWPDVIELEQENLPPFANNFLPAGLRGFAWEMHPGTTWVDYYGTNKNAAQAKKKGADPLENSFILRLIDLQAGEYPYPYIQKDQENRFSAQIWFNSKTVEYSDASLIERDWKWIISGNTSAEGSLVEKTEN